MRTTPYSKALAQICGLIGVPTSRLSTELAESINILFNANVRQIWGAGNWPDISIWGEARFAGNLLTYPNDVSQTAYWTATNASITANSIANPADNRTTASKVLETAATGEHKVAQTVTGFPSTNYQLSVYARPAGRSYIRLAADDGATTFSAFFDVQGGVVGTQANVTSADIQQCPNGYFLCTITYTSGAASTGQTISVNTSTDGSTISYAGDITKGVYLWGNLLIQQTNVSPNQFIVPYDQTGESVIDVLFQAWIDNPAMVTYPRPQGYVVTDAGFQMISTAGGFMGTNGYVSYNTNPANPVYLFYRRAPYNYSGDTFSATATYVAGQYIYYTRTTGALTGTSDYWKCLSATTAGQDPEDTPSKWELQELPESLGGILVWQTFGDWLVQDGQMDKATQAYQTAELKKLNEWDRIERQQPDNFQMQVFTHNTSQNRSW
ncbi:MAG: phage head spike fiber domain-containing protein [Steroidobacteraceae bacterium]